MQYDDLFMTNPMQSLHQMGMKAALHIEDLVAFVTIAKTDSNFFNFICIARVIHSTLPREVGQWFLFSYVLIKMTY